MTSVEATRRLRTVSRRALAAVTAWVAPADAPARPTSALPAAAAPAVTAPVTEDDFIFYEGTCTIGVAAPHGLLALRIDAPPHVSTSATWVFTPPDGEPTTSPLAACYAFYTPKALGTLVGVSQGSSGATSCWTTPVAVPAKDTATHFAYQTCSTDKTATHLRFQWNAEGRYWTADHAGTTADPLDGSWVYAFHPPVDTAIGCPCDDPAMVFTIDRVVTYTSATHTDSDSSTMGCGTASYKILCSDAAMPRHAALHREPRGIVASVQQPPGGRSKPVLLGLSAVAALLGVAWMLLYLLPDLQVLNRVTIGFSAFIPVGILAWATAAVGFRIAGRRSLLRWLAIPCVLAMAVHVCWLAPYGPRTVSPTPGTPLRVLTLNTKFGKANGYQLAALLAVEKPDLVVLNEIQQPLVDTLTEHGALTDYPYRVGNVPPGYGVARVESSLGMLVLSRLPFTSRPLLSEGAQYELELVVADQVVTVMAVHPTNGIVSAEGWRLDHAVIRDHLLSRRGSLLMVVGDLNAVPEHAPFRELTALGLTDAAVASGSGWQPTFPADLPLIPALLPIDHVLIGPGLGATTTRTFCIAESDHRGLIADLTIRS